MVMQVKFSLPWIDIDPNLTHGGISGELAGMFVSPDLTDNWQTKNNDNLKVMEALNSVSASLSTHPDSDMEGYPTRNFVEEVLQATNFILEKIIDATSSSANRTFAWTHAIPPVYDYALRPVRYPVRGAYSRDVLQFLIGDQVECAELNRNCAHSGFTPQDAAVLMRPLFEIKAHAMKLYFDLEVSGELSMAEVETMMQGKYRPGPTVSPPDESAERPSAADVAEAKTGVDVIQWYPNGQDWAVFGRLRDNRYVPERIYQPEGARDTTEDVASEQLIRPGGELLTPTSTAGTP